MTAQIGAHLELEVTKTKATQTSFGVAVQVSPERDIRGPSGPQPGKVDAYRFFTFYLAPDISYYDAFFNTVVDPIWLASSSAPAAAALREARQPVKRPACWRVLHRVTYVSRVLAPVGPSTDPVVAALRGLDLSSNYELIQSLRPYLVGHTATAGELGTTARQAIAARLPELIPHADQIVEFLLGYYGLAGKHAIDQQRLRLSGERSSPTKREA